MLGAIQNLGITHKSSEKTLGTFAELLSTHKETKTMNKTSYQVSDASIKRYWKLRKPKTIEEIEVNEKLQPVEIFNRWADSENFCNITRWEALQAIAKEDYLILQHVIYELREKTKKLNKISEAFEIINEIKA